MSDAITMTIEEFRKSFRTVTKQEAAEIIGIEQDHIGSTLVRFYAGTSLYIEDWGAEYEALAGKRWFMILERDSWFEPSSGLGLLESRLYEWGCGSDVIRDPSGAIEKKERRTALYHAMREVAKQLLVINELCIDDDDLNEELSKLNRPEGWDKNRLLTWSADEMAHEWMAASDAFDPEPKEPTVTTVAGIGGEA